MAITRATVEKVALLARLQLSDDETAAMVDDLSQIVGYIDQLSEVDTEDVEPMAHAIEVPGVLAEDEVAPSLAREEALANAPCRNERGYLVPAVLGE